MIENETALEKAIDFGIQFVSQRVPSELLSIALRVALPQLARMADLKEWDGKARLQVMATLDTALRTMDL